MKSSYAPPPRDMIVALRSMGFRRSLDSHAGGVRLVEYRLELPRERTVVVQLWGDGDHRAAHEHRGCSDTLPTGFRTRGQMLAAVLRESTRVDSRFYHAENHHTQPPFPRPENGQ